MTVNLLSRMKGNGHPKSTCEEAIGQVLSSTSLLKKSVAVCSVFPSAASHAGKATQTPSSRSERKIPAERVRATRTQQSRTVRSGPGRRLAQRIVPSPSSAPTKPTQANKTGPAANERVHSSYLSKASKQSNQGFETPTRSSSPSARDPWFGSRRREEVRALRSIARNPLTPAPRPRPSPKSISIPCSGVAGGARSRLQ
jgi:hypothetical protein